MPANGRLRKAPMSLCLVARHPEKTKPVACVALLSHPQTAAIAPEAI
jgi:hypothetical protein